MIRALALLLLLALAEPAAAQQALNPQAAGAFSITSTSSASALPTAFGATSAWLFNDGQAQAYYALGASNAVATTASAPIAPGACQAIDTGGAAYIAAITDANPTTLRIILGTGMPAGACPSQTVTVPGVSLDSTLQAVAAKLDTLIAQAVALPIPINETITGGAITTGGTFQSVLAANPARKGCIIFNTSANPAKVFPGATAGSHTFAMPIAAGQSFTCQSLLTVETQNIDYTSTSTNDTFVISSW